MTATAADGREAGRFPRPKLVTALLAVSLVLNLCFVAGATWTRLKHPGVVTTTERFHRLSKSLNLSSQQQAAFDQYVATLIDRNNRVRLATDPLLDEAWGEVAKPNPDQTKVLQLLDEYSAKRREVWHETVTETVLLLATLTPEQKAQFLADERDRRMALRRHRNEESR
jgi:Spy/CpxP family protein refolding chaperone